MSRPLHPHRRQADSTAAEPADPDKPQSHRMDLRTPRPPSARADSTDTSPSPTPRKLSATRPDPPARPTRRTHPRVRPCSMTDGFTYPTGCWWCSGSLGPPPSVRPSGSHGRLETPLTSGWAWDSWSFVCLHAGALGRDAGRGDGDRDGQAAVVAGAGRGGAAVDRGDGGDDGQAESGALMGGAVVEPLERLEDAVGIRRADDRAGIGHGQLAPARRGAGADPDVTGGGVVAGRVVDQVRDEAFGQHRVARYDGGLERGVQPPVARVGRVEDVFGDRGQVDLLVDGEPALVAREDQQRADE